MLLIEAILARPDTKTSWAGIDTMAAACGCDRRTGMRARAALEGKGALVVVADGGGAGKTTRHRIAIPKTDPDDALPATLDFGLVHHVLRRSRAKGRARAVHIGMALLADRGGEAEAGRDTLVSVTGLGRRTVIDAVKELVELGEVVVVQAGGGRGRRAVYGLRSNVAELTPVNGAQIRIRMVGPEEGQSRTVRPKQAGAARFGKACACAPVGPSRKPARNGAEKRVRKGAAVPPKNTRKGGDRKSPPTPRRAGARTGRPQSGPGECSSRCWAQSESAGHQSEGKATARVPPRVPRFMARHSWPKPSPRTCCWPSSSRTLTRRSTATALSQRAGSHMST